MRMIYNCKFCNKEISWFNCSCDKSKIANKLKEEQEMRNDKRKKDNLVRLAKLKESKDRNVTQQVINNGVFE